jgi:Tfp pilus assembly protein PilV
MKMNKRSNGFTLVEATLALTLVTVAMLSLAALFSQVVKANSVTAKKQTACLLAVAKLAQWRTNGLTNVPTVDGDFEPPFDDYTYHAIVEYRADDGLADVTLEVKHKSQTAIELWTRMRISNAP